MDVKQAVRTAKKYVADILSEEPVANIGLEEVEFDEIENIWAVTIGFSRNWSHPGNIITTLVEIRSASSRLFASRTRTAMSSLSSIELFQKIDSICGEIRSLTRILSFCSFSALSIAN